MQNEKQTHNPEPFYIVRGDRSGVFFGRIVSREGREVELTDCRRIGYWSGAASLSQLAAEGVKKPENCNITLSVQSLTILDAIELIPCSDDAVRNIQAVPEWKIK